MNDINVAKIREELGLTQGELASLLGVVLRTVQNWESGAKIPNSKYAILRKLILEREMTKSEDGVIPVEPYRKEDFHKVPFVREDATASFVESLHGGLEFEEDYFGVMPEPKEDLLDGDHIVFQVHGDSMEPTIPHRAIFLARKISEGQWENASGVVVIVYGKTLTIKRILKNSLFNDNKITLKADNPLHGQIDVYRSEIRGMWQAVRIISQKIM